MDNVSFVCANVNCSLDIHFKSGIMKHLNSEYESHSLLNDKFLLLLQFFLIALRCLCYLASGFYCIM